MTSGSDHVPFSCSDGGHPPRAYSHHTHEEPQPPFHTFTVDSTQKYHSDQELPSLAPDSPTPDSLVPSDTVVQPGFDMTTFNQTATLYQTYNDNNSDGDNSPGMFDSDNNDNSEHDQDMSDHHDSGMDVDSNESQDEDDISTQGRSESRDPPSRLKKNTRASRSRASAAIKGSKVQKTTTTAAPSKTKKSSGVANTRKSSGSTKSKTNTPPYSRLNSGKGVARLSRKHSSPSSSASPSSSPEETPEVKRQRFLERNRMAAAKCREKKRQQTLKTIADADAITSRNQALHETLEDLQEEVRTLKNQILCHRDCGCDVIQKFVKTSLGSLTGSTSSLMMSSRPERF
ncbi:hypothetical protein BGZ83_008903 [Gryganskiella cystojenkinii]|nr:hypothetical protein BGZ83_008903 [Gryganskiella cystojenkinii]